MSKLIFYAEWLPLPKEDFRILAMLTEGGGFSGNLSDLCRYFLLSPQTANRTKLRSSIERLAAQNFLTYELTGRNYKIRLVPKEKAICIEPRWFEILKAHNYSSESVAWEQVLKVLLWVINNQEPIITNSMIADDLKISVSTIGAAKNVLEREFEAITRRKCSEKIAEDIFRTIGQELCASAWWNEG